MPAYDDLHDETRICRDCGGTFLFTTGEQVYFRAKALSPPRRCPNCRKRRKETLVPDREAWHGLD